MILLHFLALPATAQVGEVIAKHGGWEVKCAKPVGSKDKKCWVEQWVASDSRPNLGLIVSFFQTADGKDRTLQVQAPLGVLVPFGLALYVDNKSIGKVPFWRCSKGGCVARAEVPDKLYDQLKKGKEAIFVIHDTPENGIGIPIALQGFSKALASLH